MASPVRSRHWQRAGAMLACLVAPVALVLTAPGVAAQDADEGSVDLNFSRIQIVVWGNGTRFSEFQVDAFAGDSLNVTALVQASRNSLAEPHEATLRAAFVDEALDAVENETTFVVGPETARTQELPGLNLSLPATLVDGIYTLRLTLDVGDAESNPVSNVVEVPIIIGTRPIDSGAYHFRPMHLVATGLLVLAAVGVVVWTRRLASPGMRAAATRNRARLERLTERWVHHPRRARNKAALTAAAILLLIAVLAASGFFVMPTGELLRRRIVAGVLVGAIYALVAIGYTMVYGVLKFINFAHGELVMVGAYAAFFIAAMWGQSFWFAVAGAVAFTALMGAAMERVAYRPLRGAPRLTPLITAIGVSLFLQGTAQFLFGTQARSFRGVTQATVVGDTTLGELLRGTVFEVFGVPVQGIGLLILVSSLVLMLMLHVFIRYSRLGKAMRAVSDDFDTAAIIGIKVDRVVVTTFVVGSSLAAVAGILTGLRFTLNPTMGFAPGIKAFTAAVVGGIGNVYGAFLGGFLIGLAENVGAAFLEQKALQEAIAFLVLIVFLIVRPTGIFAARESEVRKK